MASDWEEMRLDEVTELIIDCPHSTPKWMDEGVAVLRSNNIKNGRLDLSSPSFTNEEGYQARVKRAIPESGDLVLTREAPMGEVCQIPEGLRCCLGQRMVLLRVKKEIMDSTFLLFALQSPYLQHQISWNEGTGTTVSNIRMPNIKAFQIPTPPLPEQKAIAHILGSLDDKIELNRQMNETLEAMAQTLFKSWFVDFDPVIDNALAVGNAIPDEFSERAKQRKAIEKKDNSDIQNLFPDEFEFTEEMGWIPKGWVVGSFSEFAELDTTSVKPNSEPEKIWEHFSIPSFDINTSPVFDTGESIKSNKYKVNANAILVSKLNPETERIWWVNIQDADSAVCSTEFMQFIPKNFNHRAFIYSLLRSEYFRAEILSRVTGSTGSHQRTQPKSVAVINVLKPNEGLVSKFSQIALDWKVRVSENIEQDAILAKLRDTLLPKLISGELRISDAAELVHEAV